MLPPAQPVSRRRILRWVALGLMVCMLLFIVGGALVAWLLFKHGFGTAGIASATPHTVSTPRVAEAAPHLPTPAPRGMVAPPARQSSPVPLVAAPARQSTPVPLVAPATKPSPPSPVIALNPTPAVAPTPAAVPVGPEHTPAKIPDGVRADRSPVDSATRKAIVDRITLAPDIPAEKKEKVREIVNRAREMRRVLVLPFPSGQAELGTADAAALRNLVRAPEFAPYREDPTCAFIVLGFADTRGADDYNLRLSTDRARTVRDLLRRDSALPNIIHPVGLGKTTLLDEQQLEKNRIVEVWVIRL